MQSCYLAQQAHIKTCEECWVKLACPRGNEHGTV